MGQSPFFISTCGGFPMSTSMLTIVCVVYSVYSLLTVQKNPYVMHNMNHCPKYVKLVAFVCFICKSVIE